MENMFRILPRSYRGHAGSLLTVTALLVVAVQGIASIGKAADTTPSTPELHTFTNDSGASFKAQITAVSGDEVALKREDGQVFHPKISLFKKEDQNYIRLWAAKNAVAHGKGPLELRVVSVQDSIISTHNDATHTTLSNWGENYKVAAKNLTFVNWVSLHFRYIIFKLNAHPGELPPNDFTSMRTTGTFDVDKLSGDEEISFTTEKIPMQESKLDGSYFHTNGAPPKTADKIKGLWIRIYDDDDNLLQEWVSDPDIIKNERWAFPRAGGARGGANPGLPDPYSPARGNHPTAPYGSAPDAPPKSAGS